METLKLTPSAGRAESVSGTLRGLLPEAEVEVTFRAPDSAGVSPIEHRPERIGRETYDHLVWTYRNGFDRVLRTVPAHVWSAPGGQGWEHVKQNAKRDVWRATIDGQTYYLKYYATGGVRGALKRLLRGPACQAEWNGGIYAISSGIAAVRPAGYTERLHVDGRECSLLVTEAVEFAHPLDKFWDTLQTDPDVVRRRQDTKYLIDRVAE